MSYCSHQHICEWVGDALRGQNMLYRKSVPGMDWVDARTWSGQEAESTACGAGDSHLPLSSGFFTLAMLEKNELPSACWHYPPTEGILQLTRFHVQPFWMLLSCSVPHNKPLSAGQVVLAFCLPMIALAPRFCFLCGCNALPYSFSNQISLHSRLFAMIKSHFFSAHSDF